VLEHGLCTTLEPGLIFMFDHLCRAHFIYWYVYVYPSGIAKMRPWYSQEGQLRCSQHA
jgi:hypothetical protein